MEATANRAARAKPPIYPLLRSRRTAQDAFTLLEALTAMAGAVLLVGVVSSSLLLALRAGGEATRLDEARLHVHTLACHHRLGLKPDLPHWRVSTLETDGVLAKYPDRTVYLLTPPDALTGALQVALSEENQP